MGKLEKSRELIKAADGLSLGISIVVAIILGYGIGFVLKKIFGVDELIWLGLFIGVAASVLNVYKAYKEQVAMYDELKDDPRYKDQKFDEDEDDD